MPACTPTRTGQPMRGPMCRPQRPSPHPTISESAIRVLNPSRASLIVMRPPARAASSILELVLRTEDAKCDDKCDVRHTRHGFAMLGRGVLRGACDARNALDFRFAGFEIDIPRRELRRAGELVSIEPQVFDLLVHLVRNHDRIVTKDELIETVWKGRAISEAALSSRISAARRAVGDSGAEQTLIRTLNKRGFRFVEAVQAAGKMPIPVAQRCSRRRPDSSAFTWSDRASIAVLPFHNISGDPEQEFLADGITEDITTGLSRQQWFSVVDRNSTFACRGEAVDIRKLA